MSCFLNNLMAQSQYALLQHYGTAQYADLLDLHLEEYQPLNQMINTMLFIARGEQKTTLYADLELFQPAVSNLINNSL